LSDEFRNLKTGPASQAKPRVGYGRALKQAALVEAPASLANLGDLALRGTSNLLLGQDVIGSSAPEIEGTLRKWYGPDYVPREKMTKGERLVGDAATGALTALPFAAATGGIGIAPLLMQGLSGATGGLASGAAREMNLPPWMQFGAGMIGGMVPSAIGRLPVVGTITRGAGRRTASKIPGVARRTAEREAAGILRQQLGGTDDLVNSARTAIDAELDDMNRIGQPTLGQVLGDEHPGGLAITRMQKEISKNPTLGTASIDQQLAERSQANLAAIRQAESNLYPMAPEAAGPAAGVGLQTLRDRAKAGVRDLYDEARTAAEGAPPVPVEALRERVTEISASMRAFLSDRLPKEADEIIERFQGGTATLDDLDNLSKSLNQTMADLSRSGDKVGYGVASQIKAALGKTYDDLAAAGGPAGEAVAPLQVARAAHGASEEAFGLSHPAIKAFLQKAEFGTGTEPRNKVNLLAALRQGGMEDGAPREATRLVNSLADDPQALEGARRLAWMEILGGKPVVRTPEGHAGAALQTALKNLSDPVNARNMRVLLGDDLYESSLRLLRRTSQLTYGREGTRGALYQTGSSIGAAENSAVGALALDLYTGGNAFVINKIVRSSSAAKKFYDGTNKLQRVEFLQRALLDPRYAKFLLERVTPRNVSEWNQRFELLRGGLETGAAGIRSAGQAAKVKE